MSYLLCQRYTHASAQTYAHRIRVRQTDKRTGGEVGKQTSVHLFGEIDADS